MEKYNYRATDGSFVTIIHGLECVHSCKVCGKAAYSLYQTDPDIAGSPRCHVCITEIEAILKRNHVK